MTQKILDSNLVRKLDMPDPHLYFQAPGGQCFKLVATNEDLSNYEGAGIGPDVGKVKEALNRGDGSSELRYQHSLIHDTFTLERRYPSAPAKVYRYFSEPEYRKRWFGATEDWSQRSHSLDFRVGGQELEQGAPPGGPLITYDSRILDIVPGERIINSYVLAAAGERFSVSLSTAEFLPDGTGTLLRLTEHGAYFDGNPEGPQMRVHGISKQLDLLGRVLQKDQD